MKSLKVIQINAFKGKFLDELEDFLREEVPDFITMQEVTVNRFNLYKDKNISLFDKLKRDLNLDGVYCGDLKIKADESSTFGNAVFSKHKILSSEVVLLKNFRPVTLKELDGATAYEIRPQTNRHILATQIDLEGTVVSVISWHGAWTAPPTDTEETLRQAAKVSKYLKSLKVPFILGGDLNNIPESKTVGLIERVSKNLMRDSNVDGTLNTRVHKIAPTNFLIDFIFVSDHFRLASLEVPQITVSDHLPVVAELSFST